MRIPEFLDLLYPGARPDGACFSIWDKVSNQSLHAAVSGPAAAEDIPLAVEYVDSLVANGLDAYFGVGLRRPGLVPMRRGKKVDVVELPGVWLDVDLFNAEAHAAANLPTGIDGGAAVIDLCPFAPTLLVDSGFGLHAYWLFDHPMILRDGDQARINTAFRRFQRQIIDAAMAKLGVHVDQTGNIDRVLRIPGTKNFKIPSEPRDVEMLLADGPRHDPQVIFAQQFITQLGGAAPPTSMFVSPGSIPPPDLTSQVRHNLTRLTNQENRALMALVLAGKPFAVRGERDSTLQRAASIVAFVSPAGADPEVLGELFRPSIDAMAALADDPGNPALTTDDVVEKLTRALEDAAAKRAADQGILKVLGASPGAPKIPNAPGAAEAAEGGHAPDAAEPSSPGVAGLNAAIPDYTMDDVERFAKSQGVSKETFVQRWIIQHASGYYIFFNGRYQYPVGREALLTKVRDDFKPAAALGMKLLAFTKDGGARPMNAQEVMTNFGTVARQAKGSLLRDESFYDGAADIFWEAVAPPRKLVPAFDEKIDLWLRLLGGAEQDSLLDWIATVTTLDKQNSALYLSGKAGAGKTLLAHGLARIWTEGGPTELHDVVGTSFNSGIANCPLIFGDEAIACSTTDLRRLIGSSAHTLKRKFLPNVEIEGSLRLILADNGAKMLVNDEDMGGDDLEAVASKFLHIAVGDAPVDFLKSIGGRQGTDDWVTGDRIASHALWLATSRHVESAGRFIVEGKVTSMTRLLAVQGRAPGLVCEWIVGFISRPAAAIVQKQLAFVGGGKILINVDAISEFWEQYIRSDRPFSRTRIGTALGNLSSGMHRLDTRRYHSVRPELIYEWSARQLVGDPEELQKRVEAVAAAAAAAPTQTGKATP